MVRVLPPGCEAVVDSAAWEPPPLFATLQRAGGVSTEEMRDVFNLGVGFIAVLPADALPVAQAAARADGVVTWPMGEIRRGTTAVRFTTGLTKMDEREAMSRALDLAWKGWGRVQPNPLVGAVLLKDGNVVAEGWHAEFGGLHAEAAALEAAGRAARGATAVVTLEPCSHQGKQPPCADALIAAGVRRVVAAMADPDPVAAGGAARLRAAGVEVEIGVLERAAAAQNAIFLHNLREPDRPFVALKLATTIDGRIADANGNSRWISGAEARAFVHWLRAGFDAIGVGGVTARADDPSLTVRGPCSRGRGRCASCLRPTATFPPRSRWSGPRGRRPRSRSSLPAPGPRSSLPPKPRAWRSSAAPISSRRSATLRKRGVGSLLVEGGGRLAGALLAAGLVDRYYWVQSPLWLGIGAVPAITGLPGSALGEARRWSVSERRALGEDTLLVLDRV